MTRAGESPRQESVRRGALHGVSSGGGCWLSLEGTKELWAVYKGCEGWRPNTTRLAERGGEEWRSCEEKRWRPESCRFDQIQWSCMRVAR